MGRKLTRRGARDLADKWFSLYVRLVTQLEYGKCPFCGGPIEHCFHWFSRVNYNTRWDIRNGIGSCASCNLKMEYEPYPFYEWLKAKVGQDAVDALFRDHHKIAKFSTQDLLDIAHKYETMYNELKEKK